MDTGKAPVLEEAIVLHARQEPSARLSVRGVLKNGERSARNIRLICPAHNLYMAELDYGKETMAQFRRSADRVREPAPSFQLRT